ncbi:hypothetical protein GCM10007147_41850 [Nocardiopsis kunsanensis]|uniref:Uncharacterized protein n=1 Tax=Nocardiopsis kunsanensis TaxID=141693 RepID=A0A919CM86_9ACTN|nr:hypothetical protein GCM10007147_41850 [Nocardiopsis kunsanensis]
MVAVALPGIAGPVGTAASAGTGVVGAAAPGAFTLGPVCSSGCAGTRSARTLAVLRRATAFSLGGPAALAVTPRRLVLGRAATRTFGGSCPLETVCLAGVRPAASSGTLSPGRDFLPPATAAARTVDRAIGPSTAAFGTPSSFGTHVVLDCLSRPVGLTIPWWKRGVGPPGGSVIRDLRPRC